jgi:hypothetical protein
MKLDVEREYDISAGIKVIDLSGPPHVTGSICIVNLEQNEFRVFPFFDLINKSLIPGHGCFTEISVNLGASVRDFVEGHRHECEGLPGCPDYIPPYQDFYRKCVVACNALQTNFIRSNGFVVVNGKVIAKPPYAPGRDDPEYVERGPAGDYTCLIVDGAEAQVITLHLNHSGMTIPNITPESYGIASPHLVSNGQFLGLTRQPPPFRMGQTRHLMGDWVDWDPDTTRTSFTAFGVDNAGRLLMASVFEGEWGVHTAINQGILAREMADLLCRNGASEAILGGGGADTQQFIHGRYPRFRNGPVRSKPLAALRGEVVGIRGLGAIAAILPRQ